MIPFNGPDRRALVEEGAEALLAFWRHTQPRDQRGVVGLPPVAVGLGRHPADAGRGGGRGNPAGREEQVDLFLHGGVERGFVGGDVVHEANAVRRRGVEKLGRGEPPARLARADRRDDVGRNHRGQQAEAALGKAEFRVRRGDRDVAAGHQAHAPAERRAVHTGDGRLRQFVERAHQAGQGERIAAVLLLARRGHAAHPVQVRARRERSAFAFEHYDAHVGIARDRVERAGQRGDHRRVECVVQGRAIEPEPRDRPVAEVEQGMAHERTPEESPRS